MHDPLKKYFWDGTENLSEGFKLRRIIEYASFPDLIRYPPDKLKIYLDSIDVDSLRTSDKRKRFIRLISPYIAESETWEEIIFKMTGS